MNGQVQSAVGAPVNAAPQPPTEASLAPVLAGARARGMADALELLGVAAALIDECGFALHVNDRARSLLGRQIWLDDGRLRAGGTALDETIGAALESALTAVTPVVAETKIRVASGSRDAMVVRILPIAAGFHDPFQLVRAIVIIEQHDASYGGQPEALN